MELDFNFYLDNDQGLYFMKSWVLREYCFNPYLSGGDKDTILKGNCRVLIETALKVDYIKESGLKLSEKAINDLYEALKEEADEFKIYNPY